MITSDALSTLHTVLGEIADPVDGWLLFDFRGINPIMTAVVGPEVVGTRRAYVFIPRAGVPTALVHEIDAELWRAWPTEWRKIVWIRREQLAEQLRALVGGRRIAMEYSPMGDIPYADYVPAGTLELVRSLGATPSSSAELVSRYCSRWSDAHLAGHRRAAEQIAAIAREALALAGSRARTDDPITEYSLGQWVLGAFDRAGLVTYSAPSVSFGANAARSHYDPTEADSQPIVPGKLLLLDLWAKEPDGIYADQTWMAAIGSPSSHGAEVWEVVREARNAAISLLDSRLRAGDDVTGAEADRASRAVIERAGMLERTVCRTGHSIDYAGLHGFGPTLDDTESFDNRRIIAGVGFSIEPGIYFPGELGVRSEVNGIARTDGLEVTPREYQRELPVV